MVIAYKFMKLNNAKLNNRVHENEMLVIFYAYKVWHHYLLGSQFKVELYYELLRYIAN